MVWAGEYGLYSPDWPLERVQEAEASAETRNIETGWKQLRKEQREKVYRAAVIHYIQSGDLDIEDEDLYPLQGYGKIGKHRFVQIARSYINKFAQSIKGVGNRVTSGDPDPEGSIDVEFQNQENWNFIDRPRESSYYTPSSRRRPGHTSEDQERYHG